MQMKDASTQTNNHHPAMDETLARLHAAVADLQRRLERAAMSQDQTNNIVDSLARSTEHRFAIVEGRLQHAEGLAYGAFWRMDQIKGLDGDQWLTYQ